MSCRHRCHSRLTWPTRLRICRGAPCQYADATESLGFDPKECGWLGLPIRPFPADHLNEYQYHGIPYFLRATIGACQEYVDVSSGPAWLFGNITRGNAPGARAEIRALIPTLANVTQDMYEKCMMARGLFLQPECNHLFINTPEANYCIGSGSSTDTGGTQRSFVLQLLSLLIFLLFLVRVRSVVCYTARLEVRAQLQA